MHITIRPVAVHVSDILDEITVTFEDKRENFVSIPLSMAQASELMDKLHQQLTILCRNTLAL